MSQSRLKTIAGCWCVVFVYVCVYVCAFAYGWILNGKGEMNRGSWLFIRRRKLNRHISRIKSLKFYRSGSIRLKHGVSCRDTSDDYCLPRSPLLSQLPTVNRTHMRWFRWARTTSHSNGNVDIRRKLRVSENWPNLCACVARSMLVGEYVHLYGNIFMIPLPECLHLFTTQQ